MKKIKKNKVKHLYESYGSTSDVDLRRYLENIAIFVKYSSFDFLIQKKISPYRKIDVTLMGKIKKNLRKEKFLWIVHEHLTEEILNLEQTQLKKIDFLVKSKNYLWLLVDIGHIFDAIPSSERHRVCIITIDANQSEEPIAVKGTKMLHIITHASYMLTPE
ncbi:hypothetical protein KBB05_05460 [Patescibacteria group bacterium]|nr:hypothetical protein [Patescibacteria group bacterium]